MVVIQTERSLQFVFSALSRPPKTSDETCRLTIPDTLLYLHGSLRVWYHTDHDSHEVMKRDRREWSVQAILDAFCAGLPENSKLPVATYLHYSSSSVMPAPASSSGSAPGGGGSVAGGGAAAAARKGSLQGHNTSNGSLTSTGGGGGSNNSPSPSSTAAAAAATGKKDSRTIAEEYCRNFSEDAEPLCIDYFDRETLAAFLGTRDNKHNVVVQRFVRGTSQNITTVQMVWSPHRVVTMQRQNIYKMGDDHVPLYDRCNTHENTAHLSREVCTTAKMSARIEVECRKIVDHIAAVDGRHVVRMVAFFAFNSLSQPTLLWASELQITEQPISKEELSKQLTSQLKRKLCFISPPVVSSDVIFRQGVRGNNRLAAGGSSSMSRGITVVNSAATTQIAAAVIDKGASSLEVQMMELDQKFVSAQITRPQRGNLTLSTRQELARTYASLPRQSALRMQSELVLRRDRDRDSKYNRKYTPGFTTAESFAQGSSNGGSRPASAMGREPLGRSGSVASVATAGGGGAHDLTEFPEFYSPNPHQSPESFMSGGGMGGRPFDDARPSSAISFLTGKVMGFCRGGGGGMFLRNAGPRDVLDDGMGGGGKFGKFGDFSKFSQSRSASFGLHGSLEQQLEELGQSTSLGRRRSPANVEGSFGRRSSSSASVTTTIDWSAVLCKAIKYRKAKATAKGFVLLRQSGTVKPFDPTALPGSSAAAARGDDSPAGADAAKDDDDSSNAADLADVEPIDVYFNTVRRNVQDAEDDSNGYARRVGAAVSPITVRNGVALHCMWEYFSHKIYHAYLLPMLRAHYNALDFLEDFMTELESSFYAESASRGGQSQSLQLRVPLLLELLPTVLPATEERREVNIEAEMAQSINPGASLNASDRVGKGGAGNGGAVYDVALVGTRSAPILSMCFLESVLKAALAGTTKLPPSASNAGGAPAAAAEAAAAEPASAAPAQQAGRSMRRKTSLVTLTTTFSAQNLKPTNSNLSASTNGDLSPKASPTGSPAGSGLGDPEGMKDYPLFALELLEPSRHVELPHPSFLQALVANPLPPPPTLSSHHRPLSSASAAFSPSSSPVGKKHPPQQHRGSLVTEPLPTEPLHPILQRSSNSLPNDQLEARPQAEHEYAPVVSNVDERTIELPNMDRDRLRKILGGLRSVANDIESSAAFVKLEVLATLYNSMRESCAGQMNRANASGKKMFRGSIPTALSKPLQLPVSLVHKPRGSRAKLGQLTVTEGSFTFVMDVIKGELATALGEAERLVEWPPSVVYRPLPLCVGALTLH